MTGRRMRNYRRKGTAGKVLFPLYIALCLFSTVWLRSAVVNLEYEIGDLDRMRTDLKSARELIVASRARFFSMGNVEKVAMKRLAMTYADRDKIYFVTKTAAAGPHRASIR